MLSEHADVSVLHEETSGREAGVCRDGAPGIAMCVISRVIPSAAQSSIALR